MINQNVFNCIEIIENVCDIIDREIEDPLEDTTDKIQEVLEELKKKYCKLSEKAQDKSD